MYMHQCGLFSYKKYIKFKIFILLLLMIQNTGNCYLKSIERGANLAVKEDTDNIVYHSTEQYKSKGAPTKLLLKIPKEIIRDTLLYTDWRAKIDYEYGLKEIDVEQTEFLLENDAWKGELKQLKNWIEKEKRRKYNRYLAKIDFLEKKFNMRKINIRPYIEQIEKMSKKIKPNIQCGLLTKEQYPNLLIYLQNFAIRENLNRKQITFESMELVKWISFYGSNKEKAKVKNIVAQRDSEQYYIGLREIFEEKEYFFQKKFKNLALYFYYLDKSSKINDLKLLEEVAEYVYGIKKCVCLNKREKDIVFVDNFLSIIELYLVYGMAKYSYKEFSDNKKKLNAIMEKYVSKKAKEMKGKLAVITALYELVKEKNELLLFNILKEKK